MKYRFVQLKASDTWGEHEKVLNAWAGMGWRLVDYVPSPGFLVLEAESEVSEPFSGSEKESVS